VGQGSAGASGPQARERALKPFPAGLDTLLATKSYVTCDLYQFALTDGTTVLRFTTSDADVLYGGVVWSSKGPFFDSLTSKSRGHWKAGLDVDTWQVEVIPPGADPVTGATYPDKIYNVGWLSAARAGALDGATVDVHRAYWASWPAWPIAAPGQLVPTYVLLDVFAGRVAAIDITRTEALISINSHMELLTRTMPRNTYQAGCRWTLFDAGCAISRAGFAVAGQVSGVPTSNGTFNTTLANIADYFTLGMLTWTSGANAKLSRAIRQYTGVSGGMTLIAPMPFAVAAGDAFTAYPGCDKQMATCQTKFANLANFGGQPFIPSPETAV
jgi:uncharacterized phage protein (TIGR02218 family)